MDRLYYTAPAHELFEEVRQAAIEIWRTYDDTHGYATEKVNRVKDLANVSDNFMYIVAMFDQNNQAKLADKLSEESKQAILSRLADGGADQWTCRPFIT